MKNVRIYILKAVCEYYTWYVVVAYWVRVLYVYRLQFAPFADVQDGRTDLMHVIDVLVATSRTEPEGRVEPAQSPVKGGRRIVGI